MLVTPSFPFFNQTAERMNVSQEFQTLSSSMFLWESLVSEDFLLDLYLGCLKNSPWFSSECLWAVVDSIHRTQEERHPNSVTLAFIHFNHCLWVQDVECSPELGAAHIGTHLKLLCYFKYLLDSNIWIIKLYSKFQNKENISFLNTDLKNFMILGLCYR